MTDVDLFSPLRLRSGAQTANRIALAPMTNEQSHDDGTLGDDELAWLCSRAAGGFGTIITCAAHVARDGQGWPGELGVFDDAHVPGLTRLATALRQRGALGLVQIFHGGVRAEAALIGESPWGPSAARGVRAATPADLERVVAAFAAAAARVQRAGFDGVEIHGAHGYLLTQFLSREQNQRDDDYGGELPGRARLLREVTRAVRAATSADFTVVVRISPEDFGNARGLDLDENLQLARWLADDGIDALHLSLWRANLPTRARPDTFAVPAFRAVLPDDVAIVVAGSIWTRAEAEQQLARGADLVAIGRAAIVNPRWGLDVREPGFEPRRPPVTIAELRQMGLGPRFAEGMRRWKDFVREEP
ncbi:MAG: NADH:flavin oxidoreductase [Nannocystaceae bacterium]